MSDPHDIVNPMTIEPFLAVLLLVSILGLGVALGYLFAQSRAKTDLALWQGQCQQLEHQLGQTQQHAADDQELHETLAPLTSALTRLERHVHQADKQRAKNYGELGQQLHHMHKYTTTLQATTASLATALTATNTRGTWGEVQLRRILEHSGMIDHVDFDCQVTATTPDGTIIRPDAVVQLPGEKFLVIDAKTPMTAFLKAVDAPESDVAEHLSAHAHAVRQHVAALGHKKYWTAFTPSPEVVVCFIPNEAMLAQACTQDPTLLDDAFSQRVVLATPTTLLAVLRSVAMVWQQDNVAANTAEVFSAGRELHARLATLATRLTALGKSLNRSVVDYNKLVGSAETRLFPAAQNLAKLGVSDVDLPETKPVAEVPKNLTSGHWEEVPTDLTATEQDRSLRS